MVRQRNIGRVFTEVGGLGFIVGEITAGKILRF